MGPSATVGNPPSLHADRASRSQLLCGHAAQPVHLFDAADVISGTPFQVVRCEECSLAQTHPAPSNERLGEFYPRGYHTAAHRYRLGMDWVLGLVHRGRIRQLERMLGGPGSVLDVGCGPGHLLHHMRQRGWRTRGTERSEAAAAAARETYGLEVGSEDITTIASSGARFDAVVMWHVLEHLREPNQAVQTVAQLLRPGGVALIGVPNFGSPEARFGRERWFHLDVPRHLIHFTPETLRSCLQRAGLSVAASRHLAAEYDFFSFVQTLENRLGLPPNLLYNVLRRAESRLSSRPSGRLQPVLAVGLAVPATLLAGLVAPLAASLRQSPTITVYAVRSAQPAQPR